MRNTKTDSERKKNKTKTNMDSCIIQVYYKIGIFLGINSLRRNSKPTIWNKFTGTLLATATFVGTVCSVINRFYNEWAICIISQTILEFVEMIVELFYMVCAFLGAFQNISKWSAIFVHIKKIDKLLMSENFSVKTGMLRHYLLLLLFVLLYCCLHNFEIWLWGEEFRIEAGYILYRIVMFYQFFIIFFAISVTSTLYARYTLILRVVKQVISQENVIIQRNKHNCESVQKIKKVYLILWRIVQNFNQIFGWLIFLGTVSGFLACLGDLDYILGYYNTDDFFFNMGVIMVNLVYVSAYSVSS